MKHGTIKQVKLAIRRIAVSLNRNEKFAIEVEASEYNAKGVFQLTEAHLDNLAETAMNVDGGTLSDAIAYGNQMFEESQLIVTFKWCEAGELIGLDSDGEAILSKDGDDKHTKSYWKNESFDGIELSECAAEYLRELLKDLAKDRLKAKREGKSTKRKETPKRIVTPDVTPKTVEETEEVETEASADDLFGG